MQTSMTTPIHAHNGAPSRAKSSDSVRGLVFKLIFFCLLPVLLAGGTLRYFVFENERALLKQTLIDRAHDTVLTIDAELAQAAYFAQTLASNGLFPKHSLAQFHAQTTRLLHEGHFEFSVVLYAPDGQQLLNSNIPFGQPLPWRAHVSAISKGFETDPKTVTAMVTSAAEKRPIIATYVPVIIDKKVAYVLGVGFTPTRLNNILSQLSLAEGSVASVIDSSGTIAARTLDADQLIGQKSHPELLKAMQQLKKRDGVVATQSRQGVPVFAAYSSSPKTGWSVTVSVPQRDLEAPMREGLLIFSIGSFLALALSLAAASIVGRRLTRAASGLQTAAQALGDGKLTSVQSTRLHETDEIGLAMLKAAQDLKQREQQLQQANQHLSDRSTELAQAQKIARIGNWRWDGDSYSQASFVSDELLRQYGPNILLPFDEMKNVIYDSDTWQRLRKASETTLETGIGFSHLVSAISAENTPRWTRMIGEVVRNSAGDVTGLRGTMQNVDDQITAEKALAASEQRYRTLFDGSPEAIVVHLNGTIAFANLTATRLFEAATESDLVGKNMSQLIHENFHQSLLARQLSITELGEAAPPVEMQFFTLQGNRFHAQNRCMLLPFNGQRYVQTYIRDLTQEHLQKIEMARLRAELQDFLVWQVTQHTLAALAHEINQPLASASILVEVADRTMMEEGLSLPAREARHLKVRLMLKNIAFEISRTGKRLQDLMASVHKPQISLQLAQINALVTESIQSTFESGHFDFQIITDFADDLPAIRVNRLQLTKVLLNLIDNAGQAMQEAKVVSGRVWVSTALTATGDAVCVTVHDEGPGISKHLQAEIFHPLVTSKSRGLGMGLTISRALIEAHGGKLWLSPEVGPGATFHFTLPVSG
jgi:PAS domain S-box-containing protein